jgi:hypothetical protein
MSTATTIKLMLAGASTLAGLTISLFFWRYWKKTGDRLFAFFAVAFLLLGVERMAQGVFVQVVEWSIYFYLIRLSAFLLILYAIVDKNRNGKNL